MSIDLVKIYNDGKRAVLGTEPEPWCPYQPNTKEYKSWTDGFCFRINNDGSINFHETTMPKL